MREATGGLAASDRTIPPSIKPPSAASMSLSTVHHHSPKGVRSTRETMAAPRCGAPLQWCAGYGLRMINRSMNSAVLRRLSRLQARKLQHEVAKGGAPYFEIRVLIERGTSG